VPCSKSMAQRVLLCSALASGRTRLAPMLTGEDGAAALAALASAGVVEVQDGDDLVISGSPPPRGLRATADIDVGESGTMARLLAAALAFNGTLGHRIRLRGSGTLERRRSPVLFAALRSAGVDLTFEGPTDGWPVVIGPIAPPEEIHLAMPGSSQEVSALLIALAAHEGVRRVHVDLPIPSSSYVSMTRTVLANFHVRTDVRRVNLTDVFETQGPLRAPADRLQIVEPDASAAAVALAAGCLSGGEVRVPGLGVPSVQGDTMVIEYLRAFGCTAGSDSGALYASGVPTRGVDLDLNQTPDVAPVVAALAGAVALRHGEGSLLRGLETLPGKESSRIEVLAAGLTALGLEARASADSLSIAPGTPTAGTVELDPCGDHRMAFAFGLLSLVREGVRVTGSECVAKSWPAFWDELERSGARRG